MQFLIPSPWVSMDCGWYVQKTCYIILDHMFSWFVVSKSKCNNRVACCTCIGWMIYYWMSTLPSLHHWSRHLASFFLCFYFISSQLRLQLTSSAFSVWFEQCQQVARGRAHAQSGQNPPLRTFMFRTARLVSLPVQVVFAYDGPKCPALKLQRSIG
jgi:hypothetical protein